MVESTAKAVAEFFVCWIDHECSQVRTTHRHSRRTDPNVRSIRWNIRWILWHRPMLTGRCMAHQAKSYSPRLEGLPLRSSRTVPSPFGRSTGEPDRDRLWRGEHYSLWNCRPRKITAVVLVKLQTIRGATCSTNS